MTPTLKPSLVLASGSPRRRELFAHFGLPFEVFRPDLDEESKGLEDAPRWAERLAREKAQAGLAAHPEATVVAADTLVCVGGGLTFGKPDTNEDAKKMLRLLSGRSHEVFTGVCVATRARQWSQTVCTRVRMRPLGEAELDWYVATGEPLDKAGAYALQGRGSIFIEAIEGSWSNVVGLPLAELSTMLAGLGVALPWTS
jgi:septum formation protein